MALCNIRAAFVKQACVRNWLTAPSPRVFAAGPIQVATLKPTYGEKYPYPKPWPYKTKKFSYLHDIYDNSKARLNENSKVVVIEGNVGVGKNEFGKKLAREFDLKFFPGLHDDVIFDFYGHDVRQLDNILPEEGKSYDVKKFLNDPNPEKGTPGRLQVGFLKAKHLYYAKALLHLLSTGQGVVIVRSPHGDPVFAQALRQLGWVTRNFFRYYKDLHANSICALLRPHVTIFLDASAETCMQRIKQRKDPREEDSRNLAALLPAIEEAYKKTWLATQRRTHEVIEVDWEEVGDDMDMDVIAEEISTLVLDADTSDDARFQDWFRLDEDALADLRKTYADDFATNYGFRRSYPRDCPEVFPDDNVVFEVNSIKERHPAFSKNVKARPEFGYSKTWSFF